jgi:hypothetical protein
MSRDAAGCRLQSCSLARAARESTLTATSWPFSAVVVVCTRSAGPGIEPGVPVEGVISSSTRAHGHTWSSWQFPLRWGAVEQEMARCHLAGGWHLGNLWSSQLPAVSAPTINEDRPPTSPVPRMPFQVQGRRRRPSQMWHGGVHSSTPPWHTPSPSLVLEAFLKGTASALHIPHLVHVIIRCTTANNNTTGGRPISRNRQDVCKQHRGTRPLALIESALAASTRVVSVSIPHTDPDPRSFLSRVSRPSSPRFVSAPGAKSTVAVILLEELRTDCSCTNTSVRFRSLPIHHQRLSAFVVLSTFGAKLFLSLSLPLSLSPSRNINQRQPTPLLPIAALQIFPANRVRLLCIRGLLRGALIPKDKS